MNPITMAALSGAGIGAGLAGTWLLANRGYAFPAFVCLAAAAVCCGYAYEAAIMVTQ